MALPETQVDSNVRARVRTPSARDVVDDAALPRLNLPANATGAGVAGLETIVERAANALRLAVDVEASGMHAYQARICTVQLRWDDEECMVIDALATPIAPLAALLGKHGPTKIVHDVAFDARLFAEAGLSLGRVHDTAIAARMLGRMATGLATLLESELGVRISKAMQHYDWRIRPIDSQMLAYLGEDVRYLAALEQKLWAEVHERGIEDAVIEETNYRLECAAASAAIPTPAPELAYVRVKGAERLSTRELAALRVAAELREREASSRDVPPHRVASAEALIAVARSRATTVESVRRVHGLGGASSEALGFAQRLAVALASAGESIPESDLALWQRPSLPAATIKARRERETRLLAWRRAEAKLRGVDEQVVLPGHCVKHAAGHPIATLEDLARIPGIGAFRVLRDGDAMVGMLRNDGGVAAAPLADKTDGTA